jgi:hypothetical protein
LLYIWRLEKNIFQPELAFSQDFLKYCAKYSIKNFRLLSFAISLVKRVNEFL